MKKNNHNFENLDADNNCEKFYNSSSCDLAEQYMFYIRQTNLSYDDLQYKLIKKLEQDINPILKIQKSFFHKANYLFLKKFNQKHKHIFYLYGNVGSGKTFITNLIFRNLLIKKERKLRLSFYEFIDMLRSELNRLNLPDQNKDQKENNFSKNKETFRYFIKEKLRKIDLLCIDEFHVLDISDAMIILEFFKIIVSLPKMIVIINSNRAPDDLYKDGIHRERFLPVIDLINRNSHVMLLETKDYRESIGKDLKNFINFQDPLNHEVKDQKDFYNLFEKFAEILVREVKFIEHCILTKKISFKIIEKDFFSYIFIDFYDFFSKPLYAKNYQKFLKHFHVKKVYLSSISNLNGRDDLIKRFIAFIDVSYELGIGFVIGSSVSLDKIYTKGSMIFEFDRIISRINVLCR
jgi:cell division protein ZapE